MYPPPPHTHTHTHTDRLQYYIVVFLHLLLNFLYLAIDCGSGPLMVPCTAGPTVIRMLKAPGSFSAAALLQRMEMKCLENILFLKKVVAFDHDG
jgi:hypothetical protein